MKPILIIDDEPQIRRFLRISLNSQGFDTVNAETGQKGLELAALEQPQLIILDLGLPDRDGKEVLRELREFYQGPVIVLSVRNLESEKVLVFDMGANDYVTKPFGIKEFLARVRRLITDFSDVKPVPVVFDDGYLHVDQAQRRVAIQGTEVHLSRKEFELLKTLINHAGYLVTHAQLLNEIWGDSHSQDSHYLRVFIAKLRNKLGDKATAPRYIETEPGVGYRFLGTSHTVD